MRLVRCAAVLSLVAFMFNGTAAVADAAGGPLEPPGAGWSLKGVVVLSRHGMRSAVPAVRCEAGSPDCIDGFGDRPWPDFGVSAGNLLAESPSRASAMGRFYRERYARADVLTAKGCPASGTVSFAADFFARTVGTAAAVMNGMFPGCAFPQITIDPDAYRGPDCGLDEAKAAAASRAFIGGSWKALAEGELAAPLASFSKVLGPFSKAVCEANKGTYPCTLATLADQVDEPGPLVMSSEPSEQILMQYGSGRSGSDLGWGRLPAATGKPMPEAVSDLTAVHVAVLRALARPRYQAVLTGSQSLASVLAPLGEITAGTGPRFRFIASHDSLMSNIAGMLGLTWKLDHYHTDQVAPAQSIAFELWQPPAGGALAVRLVTYAATPQQMHDDAALTLQTPPSAAVVPVPGCSDATGSCGWADFAALSRQAIDPACVHGPVP